MLGATIVGDQLEFELPTLAGGRLKSGDHAGKVILIDAWATWCGPCIQKMPELVQLEKELAGRGLVVVGINFDETEAKLQEATAKHGLTWPQVFAKTAAKGDEHLWRDVADLDSLPRLLLVDRKGVLRHDVRPQQVGKLVRELIEEGTAGR